MTRTIGVISGKGGVGKTTFSINLSLALSKLNKRVLLIDCNVTTPHLAYYLGASNYTATINDVLKGKIPLKRAATLYNNISFIPASDNLKDLTSMDISRLENYVNRLSKEGDYDFIILDSAPSLGREAVSVLRACKEIIFVTTPSLPNLADVTKCAEVAKKIGIKDFNIVLNMIRRSDFELSPQQTSEMLNLPLLGMISFDGRVMDSTAKGVPLILEHQGSHIEHGFMEIAATLAGAVYVRPSMIDKLKRRFGLLREKIRFSR